MKKCISVILLLLSFSNQCASQVVRYATAQDVLTIKNANLGDLLITGGTETANGIPAIYIMGRDNWVVPPGKKILIKGGVYEWVGIDNSSSGTVNNPIVVTNYDGQVETKEFKVSGLKFFKLTGKYDPVKKTGDENYQGHANGYANTQGKYGIFVNSKWTNESKPLLNINGFTDLNSVDQISTDYEIEYVESGNGGYSNVFKWDGKVGIVDNVSIHDCYFHDTGGEGIYLGYTDDTKPAQVFRNLSIYNNRLIRTGYDALQLGKVVKGANIYNNVLYGGMNWRSPFMEFQDFGASLNFCDGGISFRNNIIVGGSGAMYQLGLRFQPWYSSIDPVVGDINFENNLFVNSKSPVGAYLIADDLSAKGVTHTINNNDFGGFKSFKYNEVYPTWTNASFVIKNFTSLNPRITNNVWDSTGGKTTLYNSDYGLGSLSNNKIDLVPNPIFVNFLGASDFDYTNLDLWAAKTTVGVPGTVITYKAGQFVMWKSKMYKCILQNSKIEPGVSVGWGIYWQLMNQPADDVRLVPNDPNYNKNRGLLYNTVLPVTLTNFSAKIGLNNTVNLVWSTSTEVMNKGFSIERQVDSKFVEIGFVPSKYGNSNIPLYYSFTDIAPITNAVNYYRLVQIDLDGKKTYSDIKKVKIEGRTVIYPNPSSGTVNISRSVNTKMNITVVDMSGKIIRKFNNITNSNFSFKMNNKGVYNIEIIYPQTGEKIIQNIIIQK